MDIFWIFILTNSKCQIGNTAYWDVLEHKGASAIIPVDEDGKIILVRQYRGAIDDLLLEIPAGGRDSLEEDFLVCAAREMCIRDSTYVGG